MSINRRLSDFREHLGLNQTQMAVSMGIEQSTYSKYEKDGVRIPEYSIIILGLKYNMNDEWLREGKGAMLLSNEFKIPESGNNTIEKSISSLNINHHITDAMTIETINKMLDIISRQQDDIHLAQINQANLIDKLPGGRMERKKAAGDN